MKKFKFLCCFILTLCMLTATSQENTNVEMATGFYAEGKIYVVISVIGLIFAGIIFYLFKAERKIKKLEDEIKNK